MVLEIMYMHACLTLSPHTYIQVEGQEKEKENRANAT